MPPPNVLGPGYSGYAIVNQIPVPLLPASGPENENLMKSNASYSSDPTRSSGQLPIKSRRSLVLSIRSFICPRTISLVKSLTYGWRALGSRDVVSEVPYVYVGANGEGYQGTGYVDEVSVTAADNAFITLDINLTSWVWTDLGSFSDMSPRSKRFDPLSDSYKPIPYWKSIPQHTAIGANSIPLNWSLKFNNNWNYQHFCAGYLVAPNPSLITFGDLSTNLQISWLANRRDRPQESGSANIQIGVSPILSNIVIDRMIRDPTREMTGVGSGDEVIKWSTTFYAQGAIPRS